MFRKLKWVLKNFNPTTHQYYHKYNNEFLEIEKVFPSGDKNYAYVTYTDGSSNALSVLEDIQIVKRDYVNQHGD